MHSCGPHSADSNEHFYDRMASLKRRCSNWQTVEDGVLYKGMKVFVPISMRPQMILPESIVVT